jgi:hypothetical protein
MEKSIGSDIYTGVATYGRFQAVMGAIIGTIIALILIFVGIVKMRDLHTFAAMMTVGAVNNCSQQTQKTNNQTTITYICSVNVTFIAADGKTYSAKNVTVSAPNPVSMGDSLPLRYNPNNPSDVVQEISPKLLGFGLIGFGLTMGVLSIGMAVLTFKSKGFAAVEGTLGVAESLLHRR